jgi:hypothetical protein
VVGGLSQFCSDGSDAVEEIEDFAVSLWAQESAILLDPTVGQRPLAVVGAIAAVELDHKALDATEEKGQGHRLH